jgi:hypothetical protein
MELLVSILIIFALMGLLIAGVHHAMKRARGVSDLAAVSGLKQGADEFFRQFNVYIPLVKDAPGGTFPTPGPLRTVNNVRIPSVYSFTPDRPGNANPDMAILLTATPVFTQPAGSGQTDVRFSVYSLSYYLIGTLGKAEAVNPTNDPPIDGVDGAGFCAVRRDGTFEKAGRKFQPFYDPRRVAIFEQSPPGEGRIQLRDSRDIAFRYYRWATNALRTNPPPPATLTLADLNIPVLVGDPAANPKLLKAAYAIVAAGANGVFGDEDLLPMTHPQYRDFAGLETAVGLSGNPGDAAYVEKVRRAAAADNVVEVGE